MKILFLILAGIVPSYAQYSTATATGSSTSALIIPAVPLSPIRVVGIVATSDLAGSLVSISTATNVVTVLSNATATATNLYVSSTNGLSSGAPLVLQTAKGLTAFATVASNPTGSNLVVISTGGFGISMATNDNIFQMDVVRAFPVGAATVSYQGLALYEGNMGYPVRASLTGTSTNTINSLTYLYQ